MKHLAVNAVKGEGLLATLLVVMTRDEVEDHFDDGDDDHTVDGDYS